MASVRRTSVVASIGSATLVALLLLGVAHRDGLNPRRSAVPGLDDAALHLATVTRLRAGVPYYVAVGTELRTRGYPAASVSNWRTPLHYRAVAALGLTRAGQVLTVCALAAIGLAAISLRSRFRGSALVAAIVLLGTMLPALLNRPAAVVMAEIWAGVLIALSLAAYHFRRWTAGALVGVLAIFVRELAAPYGLVCGVLAWREQRRAEGAVWVIGGFVYAAYFAFHAGAVMAAVQPTDYAWPQSWLRWLGWPFVLQTAWVSGWTIQLPYLATPIVAVLALAGTAARSMPPQLRWSLLAYVLVFSAVGQEFNFYWGFVTAPLWAYALLYTPEGLRALCRPVERIQGGDRSSAATSLPDSEEQSWRRAKGTEDAQVEAAPRQPRAVTSSADPSVSPGATHR